MALKYIVLSRGVERTDSQTDGRITAWLVDTLYLRWDIKIIRGLGVLHEHPGPLCLRPWLISAVLCTIVFSTRRRCRDDRHTDVINAAVKRFPGSWMFCGWASAWCV